MWDELKCCGRMCIWLRVRHVNPHRSTLERAGIPGDRAGCRYLQFFHVHDNLRRRCLKTANGAAVSRSSRIPMPCCLLSQMRLFFFFYPYTDQEVARQGKARLTAKRHIPYPTSHFPSSNVMPGRCAHSRVNLCVQPRLETLTN